MSQAIKSVCRACNQTFVSVRAFDFHRTGSYGEPIYGKSGQIVGYTPHQRRCLTVEEMVALGMTQNVKGWWQMPARVKTVAEVAPGEGDEEQEEEETEREVA